MGSDGTLSATHYSVLRAFGLDPQDVAVSLTNFSSKDILEAPAGTVAAAAAACMSRAITGEGSKLNLLAQRWAEWISAEQTGQVAYERFKAPQEQAWYDASERWDVPSLHNPQTRDLVARLRRESRRSAALNMITDAGLEKDQAYEMTAWYETAYADFIARNNGADWIDIIGGSFSDVLVSTAPGVRARVVILRGAAPVHLGAMPQSQYEILCYRVRHALTEWREAPTREVADRVAYAIERAQGQDDLVGDRRSLRFGLFASFVATGAITLFDGLSEELPESLWLVPFATLGMTMALEWYSVRTPIRAVRKSTLSSSIHLTSG